MHPEADDLNMLEPSVGEQLRLNEFLRGIDELTLEELREVTALLAEQALMMQPAAIRWLAREAARNLIDGNL